ncbi:MAG: YbaK/EbsC family protein [Candidatus Heimdallarchaeota archaeon]|nr:MAG: YbaK/EbsC family protein [Candidatus Heimdallarchaeota archaeon]
MKDSSIRLQGYISENQLKAKIISLETSTKTVDESVQALGCRAEDIIKSIIVVTNTNEFFLVILQGNRKIKTKKIKKLLNVKDVKLASPGQVEKETGYKVGDVPPISIVLPVILDELVLEVSKSSRLYGGGGASSKLLAISIDELLDCTHPLIADVSIAI